MSGIMPSNAAALSRLILVERSSLLRLTARIVGSAPAAEDVTQSLWLRVQRIKDDPPIINKRAFLYRLAENLANDQARADRRHRSLFEAGEAPLDIAVPEPSAETLLIDRNNLAIVMRALEELPPRCRQVFEMRRIEEIPVEEVSAQLGISRSMIARHMRHALHHCLTRLHEHRD
jgi:RNA polymerase sigma-70 factor (ECF subfamily)